MPLFLIFFSLAVLWLGTRWIISGATGLANRFQLSHTFVGVAVLAVGTDLPELSVTVNASLLQLNGIESSGIITGNAIGSCLSQITVILGISGLLLRFHLSHKDVWRDGIALVFSLLLLFAFGWDGIITRWEGGILLLAYLLYYVVMVRQKSAGPHEPDTGKKRKLPGTILYMMGGFALLIISSHIMVTNALLLAEKWGVAQSFIGIAIVGLGTSLPELAVSIGAALRKSAGMTVGNIIGSNIFDSLIPVGLGGLISTTRVERSLLTVDLPLLLCITLGVLLVIGRKNGIAKWQGALLIAVFIGYMALKLLLL